MIKCLLITHGNLGQEMIDVAGKIMEYKIDVDCLRLDWCSDGSDIISQVEKYLAHNKDHEILIFTDMFGGSPFNISTKYINSHVEVITGINLPGLLKFITQQRSGKKLKEIVKNVERGAIEGISVVSKYLGEKKP